MFPIEFANKFV